MSNAYDYYRGKVSVPPGLFVGGSQTFRRKAACTVWLDGIDVTNRLDPHLLSVVIRDRWGYIQDEATIELDDRDGRLQLPPIGRPRHWELDPQGQPMLVRNTMVGIQGWSTLTIELGWHTESMRVMFHGYVEDVQSTGAKRGGRRLFIHGRGGSSLGLGKQSFQDAWGEGKPPGGQAKMIGLSEVLQGAAKKGGMNISVAPSLGNIKRDYWSQMNESFYHMGTRLGRELGGVFKVSGGQATFTKPGHDVNDNVLETVYAIWADNLIMWNIHPFIARPQYESSSASIFDAAKATWSKISSSIGGGSAPFAGASEATKSLMPTAPNDDSGGQQNEGQEDTSDYQRGTGHLVINGEPKARAQTYVEVRGTRPGVDARYGVSEADHIYSREGYTTRLTVMRPQNIRNAVAAYWGTPETATAQLASIEARVPYITDNPFMPTQGILNTYDQEQADKAAALSDAGEAGQFTHSGITYVE